ncbi:MAG: biopolymer transporter ExbD [Chlamydiales bacterium]|nr:biopolymer transporter ExbD [Chlamydiales bacterium]
MRRRIRAIKSDNNEEAMINLTPLIDVVFVMLIMFIVVAPILELDQVELAKGHTNTKEISSSMKDSSPISIHVQKDNTIFFNKMRVSVAELRKLLKEANLKNPNVTPLLFHDKKALFGTYQEVKNAVEDAGFKDLNIVLNP